MKKKMDRRKFIKSGSLLGTAALVGGPFAGKLLSNSGNVNFKITSVKSSSRFNSTVKVVELLGGMKKFIQNKGKVGLLINAPAWWRNPGSFVHPDIVLATVKMCLEAGADEIIYLINPPRNYYNRTDLKKKYSKEISEIRKCSGKFVKTNIPKGKSLKKGEIIKELFECDSFINIPILKHHTGVHISSSIKNMMGLNSSPSNQFFHDGSGAKEGYDDIKFLSQCVADLNTLRKPDLCIMDATVFLKTGGPAGPGRLKRVNRVVAGIDPVAVDSYCSGFLGHKPGSVEMIKVAHENGIGNMFFTKKDIKSVSL